MTPSDIIARKRDGDALTDEQIRYFMRAYGEGRIADYQMSALAMAIYLQGMDPQETAALTMEMLHSGVRLTWPGATCPVVGKHSTGGIGDKVSLVLAPLLACCGVQVPKISGRGLGPTGGTLDKLESIPGFRTDLTIAEIQELTRRVGCVITGATAQIAPADRRLYALRDVTATVASIPLITASIMSKKLAEGLDALVLDVKCGSGAFMKTREEARQLAQSLVRTGARLNLPTTALITDMNQPLGRMIGNAVEVNEAVDTLAGRGPADLLELTLTLGEVVLTLSRRFSDRESARQRLTHAIASGEAAEKLGEMCKAQGGHLSAPRPVATKHVWRAPRRGVVASIDAEALGKIIIELGGGRQVATDAIDHSVGLEMLVRLGESVQPDQPLLHLFAASPPAGRIPSLLNQAITIGDERPEQPTLILERIEA